MKIIPHFDSEQEERDFWLNNDTTEYMDWSKAKLAKFPNLQRSTQTISLRLTENMLEAIKNEAKKIDVPYQSLMKIWLNEKIEKTIHP
jgi:predicted DNA binding CopG/RHH family protein